MGFTTFAVGAGVKAVGAYQSAQAQKTADRTNAQLETDQASAAITAGQTREQASRLNTAQVYGGQRAALAANGVDLGTGSATDILATTQMVGNRDAAAIQDNALREAWGFKSNAAVSTAAADSINPFEAAAGSLLGSATTTAGSSAFRSMWSNKSPTAGGGTPNMG